MLKYILFFSSSGVTSSQISTISHITLSRSVVGGGSGSIGGGNGPSETGVTHSFSSLCVEDVRAWNAIKSSSSSVSKNLSWSSTLT